MRRTTTTALTATLLLATLTACSTSDSGSDKPAAPPYKVVQQDTSGNSRDVIVEVDSTERLDDVFNAVAHDLTDEAGYHVYINCSTGGTAGADNRLGNGRKAVGTMGKAATGLDDGQVEYASLEGRTCPKK